MQFRKIFIGLCLLFSHTVLANYPGSTHFISKNALKQHVNFLCDESLEGRLTGSRGEKIATQYIANLFLQYGLQPAGDNGTFFQKFKFTSSVSLGKTNTLKLTHHGVTTFLKLNKDWRPLSISKNTVFKNTKLVFVGYGITAPAKENFSAYDSYQGLNVKNKWVVVFTDIPASISHIKNHPLTRFSSLRYRAFNAKAHGATGIIYISGKHAEVKNELIEFSSINSPSSSGMIALAVRDSIMEDLLQSGNHAYNSLSKLQNAIDSLASSSTPKVELNLITMSGQVDIQKNIQYGRNVLAKLKMNANTSPIILISAHIDHLGRGELGSSLAREDEIGMIHPGADDNASGVASILEVAAYLSKLKNEGRLHGNKDILFAIWSGEELGTFGSSHFVNNFMETHRIKSLNGMIDAVINLDMIGHLRKKLVMQGVGSSPNWTKIINKIQRNQQTLLISQTDPYLPTDSTVFYLNNVPTLNFFTGAHSAYHSPRDKAQTLDYAGIKIISEILIDMIFNIEDKNTTLAYRKVKKLNNFSSQELKVYLGTIPDYTSFDAPGVKLSGVRTRSPADLAGIKQNDVIIELNGKKIHDIYDYTFAINTLPIGKAAKILVLRSQTKIALSITAKLK